MGSFYVRATKTGNPNFDLTSNKAWNIMFEVLSPNLWKLLCPTSLMENMMDEMDICKFISKAFPSSLLKSACGDLFPTSLKWQPSEKSTIPCGLWGPCTNTIDEIFGHFDALHQLSRLTYKIVLIVYCGLLSNHLPPYLSTWFVYGPCYVSFMAPYTLAVCWMSDWCFVDWWTF